MEILRHMAKYQIYGIGAALVDTEVVVSDEFLEQNQIEKGVMTLVDEPRQAELLNAFSADQRHLMKKSGRLGLQHGYRGCKLWCKDFL